MNIIIIGGGASGLIAAIMAARNGATVTILEQNDKLGRKILASGNGRCNLTNTLQEPTCYRGECPPFAWNLIQDFGLSETLKFFTQLGIYTKNKNGWMYPYSEQASSVLELLLMEATHYKVKIKTQEEVVAILPVASGFDVTTTTWTYHGDKLILAAGSAASIVKGSGSSGYQLAKSLGHTIVKPLPALVALRGNGNYFAQWAGVRIDATATLFIDSKAHSMANGELQLTDYGISGIPIFQLSRFAVRALEQGARVTIVIDFMPDFTAESLTIFLESRLKNCPYKSLEESLIGLLPKKLIKVVSTGCQSMAELAAQLKQYQVIVKGAHSMEQAQVCSGGVDTQELDPQTLESKLIPGVYVTGELVDVDGQCGGYNLQWAWSSGAIAGFHSAKQKE